MTAGVLQCWDLGLTHAQSPLLKSFLGISRPQNLCLCPGTTMDPQMQPFAAAEPKLAENAVFKPQLSGKHQQNPDVSESSLHCK